MDFANNMHGEGEDRIRSLHDYFYSGCSETRCIAVENESIDGFMKPSVLHKLSSDDACFDDDDGTESEV